MTPSTSTPLVRWASRSPRLLLGGLVLVSLSGGVLSHASAATTHVVTSLADPGADGCTPDECTLREAIGEAVDGDTITFEPALFTQGRQTLRLRAGALFLDKHLTLVGPGHTLLVLNAHRASAVLRIPPGKVVVVTNVTITRGLALPAGGIDNAGTLTLAQCTIRSNTGSGIYNRTTGILSLRHSTIRANTFNGLVNEGTARLAQSTVHGNSVGIGNSPNALLTLQHTTISSNTVTGLFNRGTARLAHNTLSGNGRGIFNDGNALLTLQHTTISSNTITGLFNAGALRLHSTLIAGNVQASLPNTDCAGLGTVHNDGFNLTGLGTGCPTNPQRGDVTVDPARVFTHVLQPLRSNGGPTRTQALRPGSPAVDAGDPVRCGGTDQRGVARPQGARCDIGAFEREQP